MADTTAKKKKLPFKQTAIRRTVAAADATDEAADDDGGLSLFRRSGHMAPKIKEEHDRRMKRKQEKLEEQKRLDALEDEKRRKQKEQADRMLDLAFENPSPVVSFSRSGEGLTTDESMTTANGSFHTVGTPSSSAKRPRASPESSTGKTVAAQTLSDNEDAIHDTSNSPKGPFTPSTRLTRSGSKRSTPRRQRSSADRIPVGAAIIAVDSDTDEALSTPAHKRPRVATEALEDYQVAELHDDEDVDSIWETRAAEKRALQQQQAENGTTTVEILVTTTIPNAHKLKFKTLFHRPLKLVREAWYDRQEKKEGVKMPVLKEDVVLTWRRKKVFSTDTLLVLGFQLQPYSRAGFTTGDKSSEGMIDDTIHMETWTADGFREMQEAEKQRQRHEAGEYSPEPDSEPEPEIEVKRLRIFLKAKDLPQVRLSVREETTVDTAVGGFRKESGVGSDKVVSLWFDGEELEEHVTMEQAGIEDKDTIDVHIR